MNSPRVFQLLEQADWETLYKRLLVYTLKAAANLCWQGVQGSNFANGELAKGVACEDLVSHVIEDVFSGTRHWDPDKGELEYWLKQQIKSEISHLIVSPGHLNESNELSEESDVSPSKEEAIFTSAFYLLNPEIIILTQEQVYERVSAVYAAANSDPQLEAIILAILDGCEQQPRYLAEELETTIEDINNRLRKLRRHAIRDNLSL